MLIHKHMEKRLIVIKNQIYVTSWQEKNKNHHSDLKQYKIKPPCLINFLKNWPEKLMINFFWPYRDIFTKELS